MPVHPAVLLVETYLVIEILFQLLLRPISNDSAKDIKKPLGAGSKDPSTTQGSSEDQGSGAPEAKPVASVSSTQLVHVVADLDRLQEQVARAPGCRVLSAGFSQSVRTRHRPPVGLGLWGPRAAREITSVLSSEPFP